MVLSPVHGIRWLSIKGKSRCSTVCSRSLVNFATVCPRSVDPFYIVSQYMGNYNYFLDTQYIRMDKASWICSCLLSISHSLFICWFFDFHFSFSRFLSLCLFQFLDFIFHFPFSYFLPPFLFFSLFISHSLLRSLSFSHYIYIYIYLQLDHGSSP